MRIVGWLAMALAVMGVIAGLALAGGVWVLRPDIEARARELVVTADSGLERAITLTATVATRLGSASDRVGNVKTRADELAAAPVIDPAVRTDLATRIDDFITGPYAALRTDYAALRERVAAVGEALQALDSAIDAVSLPGVVMERLQAIDTTLVQLDAAVTSLAGMATARLSEPGMAARVSEQAAAAQEALATIGQLVTDVGATMQATRDQLAGADDRIATFLTAGAGVATVFGLYLAGLNILLFQQGRRWSRRETVTPLPTPA